MKTLHLSLKKQPFDVMHTGEKNKEFRKDTPWIRSRLLTKNGERKHYDVVKFTNGYGSDKPCFIAEYKGFEFTEGNYTYSNGLKVVVTGMDFTINLGKVIAVRR
jgi:hypothetical protein